MHGSKATVPWMKKKQILVCLISAGVTLLLNQYLIVVMPDYVLYIMATFEETQSV